MTWQDDVTRARFQLRPPREFEQTVGNDDLLSSDRGRAQFVAGQYGRQLAYVPGRGWLVCSTAEKVWEADAGGLRVMQLIADATGATSSATVKRSEEMLRLERRVAPEDFVEHPEVLHCAGGQALVLRTGEVRPAEPEDFCTWSTGVRWNPSAGSEPWARFLAWVLPDPDARDWVQRWFGYCLAPRSVEEKVLLLHGPGGDGKSTLLEAVAGVLGRYAQGGVDPALVLRGGRVDHPTEIASLAGKRLAWINELADDARLDEGKLKRLVSTGSVRARFIARDYIEVPISWKFVMTMNTRPEVVGQSTGTWRRLQPLQLRSLRDLAGQVILDPANPGLTELKEILDAPEQREAILRWLVVGYQRWLNRALGEDIPSALRDEAEAYRDEEDVVGEWCREVLVFGEDRHLLARDLRAMVERSRTPGIGLRAVERWLETWGYRKVRHASDRESGVGWRGVGLRQVVAGL